MIRLSEDAFPVRDWRRCGSRAASTDAWPGTSDIEFLHDLQTAFQESGRGNGPSEELTRTFKSVSAATRAMDTAESGSSPAVGSARSTSATLGGRPSG